MTMHHIQSEVLGSDGTITFSNIPQTFSHLQLRIFARSARSGFSDEWFLTRLNGDSGSNYASHTLRGFATGVDVGSYVSTTFSFVGFIPPDQLTNNIYGNYVLDILDYSSTSKNKTIKSIGGYDTNNAASINSFATIVSGLWMNTSAVTSISLIGNALLKAGTRADLYGITTNPIATGA